MFVAAKFCEYIRNCYWTLSPSVLSLSSFTRILCSVLQGERKKIFSWNPLNHCIHSNGFCSDGLWNQSRRRLLWLARAYFDEKKTHRYEMHSAHIQIETMNGARMLETSKFIQVRECESARLSQLNTTNGVACCEWNMNRWEWKYILLKTWT